SLKNERYYFGSLSSDNSFYFSDLEMRYKAIPKKLTLHFLAANIWDTDTFRNYTINETGFASSNFRLLPRYFFLKVDYRF
ncbi:MAG: TonB-dependent receptor, partial [Bacteroidia bacterium]|nr:TonB-dependent receptor [Bacteroidia bacterium]